ncbi:DAK2 domain-containing protein, partial [Corallococcus exiguus]
WAEATHAAEQGAEATASMSPRLGRASYLGERAKGVPDAGAVAVVIWMKALGVRAG